MKILIRIVAPLLLAIHGFIHLFGTMAYLQLADIQGFPYKTTVLNGAWDVGEVGIAVFGVMWAVAAAGFITSAVGMFTDSNWALPLLAATTALSMLVTGLDFVVASTGLVVNITITVILLLVRARRRDIDQPPG